MTRAWRVAGVVGLLTLASCSGKGPDDSNIARGRGLTAASLTPAAEAGVVDAAVRASFQVEPGLVLRAAFVDESAPP